MSSNNWFHERFAYVFTNLPEHWEKLIYWDIYFPFYQPHIDHLKDKEPGLLVVCTFPLSL